MNNNIPYLFLYWENPPGKRMPAYIALCRAVIEYHCSDMNIQVIGPDNIQQWLPELPPNINRVTCTKDPNTVSLALKTGFIRVFLLEKYGGIYIDSDTIPLKTLSFLWEICKDGSFVAVRRSSAKMNHISTGLLAGAQCCDILKTYSLLLYEMIRQKTCFKWAEIGAHALTPIVNANIDKCSIIHERCAHPIVAERQHLFMSKTLEPDDVLHSDTFNVMLFHRPFVGPSAAIPEYGIEADKNGWLREWDVDRLYYGNIFLSKIFRKALPENAFMDKRKYILRLME